MPQNDSNSHRGLALLVLIAACTLSLLILEVASRWLLPPPYGLAPEDRDRTHFVKVSPPIHVVDPEIGWVLTPATVVSRHKDLSDDGSPGFDVTYSIRHGLRATSLHDDGSTSRVVTTGCSFTFGHGVNDADSWPWLLAERSPAYAVDNVACMAYGTDQALMAAERRISHTSGTRAVVLGFTDFQIERNRSAQGWMVVTYPFSKPLFTMQENHVSYRGQVIFRKPLLDQSVFLAHLTNTFSNRFRYHIVDHNEARKLTLALMTEFAGRFREHGAALVVVILPYAEDQAPQAKTDRAFIIEGLRNAHIAVLVPDFPRLPDGRIDRSRFTVSKSDKHPNRNYNSLLAEQLAHFLETSVLNRDMKSTSSLDLRQSIHTVPR